MSASVETSAQQDLQAILQARMTGIANFNIRMAPTNTESFPADVLPLVLICPRQPGAEGSKGLGFEGSSTYLYVEEVIVLYGIEGDLETDQPVVQSQKEAAVYAIEHNLDGTWRTTLPDTPSIYDVRVSEVKGLEPSKLADNYAYESFFTVLRSSE